MHILLILILKNAYYSFSFFLEFLININARKKHRSKKIRKIFKKNKKRALV